MVKSLERIKVETTKTVSQACSRPLQSLHLSLILIDQTKLRLILKIKRPLSLPLYLKLALLDADSLEP